MEPTITKNDIHKLKNELMVKQELARKIVAELKLPDVIDFLLATQNSDKQLDDEDKLSDIDLSFNHQGLGFRVVRNTLSKQVFVNDKLVYERTNYQVSQLNTFKNGSWSAKLLDYYRETHKKVTAKERQNTYKLLTEQIKNFTPLEN